MLTRKQFLARALHMSAGLLGLTLLNACGDDDTGTGGGGGSGSGSGGGGGGGGGGGEIPVDAPPSMANNCVQNGTNVTIRTNHGHILMVPKEDVAARAEKSYDIRGSADHTHTVVVTADLMAQLATNMAVMTSSTLNSSATFGTHSHDVLIACI
jgi:hypothetical protein